MTFAGPIRRAEAAPGRPVPTRAPAPRKRSPPLLQPKLAIGAPTDRFEREADQAASHVVGGRGGIPILSPLIVGAHAQRQCARCKEEERNAFVQRKCSACGARFKEDARAIQRKCKACQEHDEQSTPIQRQCARCSSLGQKCDCEEKSKDQALEIDRATKRESEVEEQALAAVEAAIARAGRPLPDNVREQMEEGFGRDFSSVRIHDGLADARSAEAIGAHAYTVGNHIVFNRGQFAPATQSGRLLLAHELAHTVQQSGARPVARRVSNPGDRHEVEADRAAAAAISGATMPALSISGPSISRWSLRGIAGSLYDLGADAVNEAGDLIDRGVELAEDAYDAATRAWDLAVEIATAVAGHIHRDGTTIVVDVPQFDPCPHFEFAGSIRDIGIEPLLYFPIAAGAFSIGPVTVAGVFGAEATLKPGLGIKLDGCNFGPSQIRISPLSLDMRVIGAAHIRASVSLPLEADLGLNVTAFGAVTLPFDPPLVLMAPGIGLTAGGTLSLMLQGGGEIDHQFDLEVGLSGISERSHTDADIFFGASLAYGLFGSVSIAGMNLCRVVWPLGDYSTSFAAGIELDSDIALGAAGVHFNISAGIHQAERPLDDLSFAVDNSRVEDDDCVLCDFFRDNHLMPKDYHKDWRTIEPGLPRIDRGPLTDVYARSPEEKHHSFITAKCRGTCGVDCPDPPTCTIPYDRDVCQEINGRHVWYTYTNYAVCGTHAGCRNHDACYDFASNSIGGFGGVLIGPMYRWCDLEAMCDYSFQQGVRWALGEGPYDGELAYADDMVVSEGCRGPCPQTVADEGEEAVQETCLVETILWDGLRTEQQWSRGYGPWKLYRGFVEVPYIGGIHYGLDGSVDIGAGAGAQIGPVTLENACLTYDPNSRYYTGAADLVLNMNAFARASVTGTLSAWGADVLCLAKWLALNASLRGDLKVEVSAPLTASVALECFRGSLAVIPELSLTISPKLTGALTAEASFDVLGVNVLTRDWKLLERSLQTSWDISFDFDTFLVDVGPTFKTLSDALDVGMLLADLFGETHISDVGKPPATNPIKKKEDRSALLPCLKKGSTPSDDEDCPKATNSDGERLLTPAQRRPRFGERRILTITAGATAPVATWMEAPYLVSSLAEGPDTIPRRVQRGIYGQPGLPNQGCVKFGTGVKNGQYFARGHLLSYHLGGPPAEENLFPITEEANGVHRRDVEAGLISKVGVGASGDLTYYKVTVQGVSAPRAIPNAPDFFEISSTFRCEVGDYKLCKGDRLVRNPAVITNIQSNFVFTPPFETVSRPCRRAGGSSQQSPAQPKMAAAASAASNVPTGPPRTRPLPNGLRHGAEGLSGMALGGVRVHHNSAEPARLGALAFAHGTEIHLAPGQERHLAHEAWHVVQQLEGRVDSDHRYGRHALNQDRGLEDEADRMGEMASRLGQRSPSIDGLRTKSAGPRVIQRQEDPQGLNEERDAALSEAMALFDVTIEDLDKQADAEDELKLKRGRQGDQRYAWSEARKDKARLEGSWKVPPELQREITIKLRFFTGKAKKAYLDVLGPVLSTFPEAAAEALAPMGSANTGKKLVADPVGMTCDISRKEYLLQYEGAGMPRCMNIATDEEYLRDYFDNNIVDGVLYATPSTTWENVQYDSFKTLLVRYRNGAKEIFMLDAIGRFHLSDTMGAMLEPSFVKMKNGLIYPLYRGRPYLNEILAPKLVDFKNQKDEIVAELRDLYDLLQLAGIFAQNMGAYGAVADSFHTAVGAFQQHRGVGLEGSPLPGIRARQKSQMQLPTHEPEGGVLGRKSEEYWREEPRTAPAKQLKPGDRPISDIASARKPKASSPDAAEAQLAAKVEADAESIDLHGKIAVGQTGAPTQTSRQAPRASAADEAATSAPLETSKGKSESSSASGRQAASEGPRAPRQGEPAKPLVEEAATAQLKAESATQGQMLKEQRKVLTAKIDAMDDQIAVWRETARELRREANNARIQKQATTRGQKLMSKVAEEGDKAAIAKARKDGVSEAKIQEAFLSRKAEQANAKVKALEAERAAPTRERAQINHQLKKIDRILSIPEKAGGSHKAIAAHTVKGDSEAHHPVAVNAYLGEVELSYGDGPAIHMLIEDHVQTRSYSDAGYRATQKALVREGKFLEAFDMDAADIRARFPDGRYENGLAQARRYLLSIDPAKLTPLSTKGAR